MLVRTGSFLVLCIWLGQPALSRAQVTEPDDTEVIKPIEGRKLSTERLDLGQVAQSINRQTNALRREESVVELKVNPRLTAAAQYFADYMARNDQYGHGADGSRPAARAAKHGYEYCLIAENIAYQYSSAGFTADPLAQKFFEGWKKSPGHRKNMVDPDVTESGVAVARSPQTGYYYAVQLFGRPKSAALEFTIANQSERAVEYQIGGQTFPLPPRLIRTHRRCRPADVEFQWSDSEGTAQTVRPKAGDRFNVVDDQGTLQLQKE